MHGNHAGIAGDLTSVLNTFGVVEIGDDDFRCHSTNAENRQQTLDVTVVFGEMCQFSLNQFLLFADVGQLIKK